MAIEIPKYKVLKQQRPFELREYPKQILAETIVDGSLENAGNRAFNRLLRYITGQNQSRAKVAMTSPVEQTASGEKISMTAPVEQKKTRDKWAVGFIMPSTYTMESLPKPLDSDVELREVPPRQLAVVRYSGFWTKKSYNSKKESLEQWIAENNLNTLGEPVWARYNPPFTPWFLRRNEIQIPVQKKEE
jgi:hypothetical protein